MKNKKIISFRTKAEVILVAALFIGICVSSVWGTVTMTDKTTTTDDSGLIINYEEGWINVWNVTIDNESVDSDVINQWNLAYNWRGDRIYNESKAATIDNDMMLGWNASNVTLIRNSNGMSYPATFDGLQEANYDLNSTNGGWVGSPSGVIDFINGTIYNLPLMIGNHTWNFGCGNSTIWRRGTNVHVDMIRSGNCNHLSFGPGTSIAMGSVHADYKVYGIRISDLVIDGNDLNQNYDLTVLNKNYYMRNIILVDAHDILIENCMITNGSAMGIYAKFCERLTVTNCEIKHLGLRPRTLPDTGINDCLTHGIWLASCDNVIINDNIMYDNYNGGIAIEKATDCQQSSNVVVDGNVLYNQFCGIWIENGRNVTVTNNIIHHIHGWKTDYGVNPYLNVNATGILVSHYSINVGLSGNLIHNISYYEDDMWKGIGIHYGNIDVHTGIIDGNIIRDIGNSGIWIDTYAVTISDNIIERTLTSSGIYIYSEGSSDSHISISAGHINDTATDGIYAGGNKGNLIIDGVSIRNSGDIGVDSTWYNTSITDTNIINPVNHGIRIDMGNDEMGIMKLNDNTITGLSGSSSGIYSRNCENGTINDNVIVGDTKGGGGSTTGIKLQDSHNISVIGNRVKDCDNGIYELDSSYGVYDCGYNFISNNHLMGNTNGYYAQDGGGTQMTSGNGSKVEHNFGYTTESIGIATIPSGSVSLVVNHNMSVTPFIVLVTPRGNLSSAGCDDGWWYDTVTSTQFTIHVSCSSGTLTSAVAFGWKAEYN